MKISIPQISVNNDHDPVYSSFRLVQFFQGEVCHKTAAQKKESVDTGKSIGNCLKHVGAGQLKKKYCI